MQTRKPSSAVCVALVALAVLAGCGGDGVTTSPEGETVVASSETCNAQRFRGLVGQQVDDMAALSVAAPKVRLIFPGDAVTQDFRDDRLNVEFDEARRVTRVWCG